MIATAWSSSDTYLSLTVLVLLILSGFLALAETSLVRMNKSRARSLREQHRRGSRALTLLTESPQKFLNPILLLVLICQLVSATMVGVLTDRLFGAAGIFIGIVGEVVVVLEGATNIVEADDATIRAALLERLGAGSSVRDAAAFVADTLGASRRVTYEIALALRVEPTP